MSLHTASGCCTSSTVTVNEHTIELPLPSVAVYEIVCGEPLTLKNDPGVPPVGPVTVTSFGGVQSSIAVGGVQFTKAPQSSTSLPTVMFAGQFTQCRPLASSTVMLNVIT